MILDSDPYTKVMGSEVRLIYQVRTKYEDLVVMGGAIAIAK